MIPHFLGLEIVDVLNTSCVGCDDGGIVYNLDQSAACVGGCEIADVKVLRTDNLSDVTDFATEGALSAGDYYVVVTEEGTGCYLAFERVTIE